HAEAALQAARHVVFAAAFPDAELARRVDARLARIEPQHHFTQRHQVPPTSGFLRNLKRHASAFYKRYEAGDQSGAFRGTFQRRSTSGEAMRWLDDLRGDLLYALRTLRRSPAFAAAAIVSLALGIGANTLAFSVIRSLLLRPLPFDRPHEV